MLRTAIETINTRWNEHTRRKERLKSFRAEAKSLRSNEFTDHEEEEFFDHEEETNDDELFKQHQSFEDAEFFIQEWDLESEEDSFTDSVEEEEFFKKEELFDQQRYTFNLLRHENEKIIKGYKKYAEFIGEECNFLGEVPEVPDSIDEALEILSNLIEGEKEVRKDLISKLEKIRIKAIIKFYKQIAGSIPKVKRVAVVTMDSFSSPTDEELAEFNKNISDMQNGRAFYRAYCECNSKLRVVAITRNTNSFPYDFEGDLSNPKVQYL